MLQSRRKSGSHGSSLASGEDLGPVEIGSFQNRQNLRLCSYVWPVKSPKAVVVFIHGVTSHARFEFCNHKPRINSVTPPEQEAVEPPGPSEMSSPQSRVSEPTEERAYCRSYSYEGSWFHVFNQNGIACATYDQQGHGRSQGWSSVRCNVEFFDDFAADALQFCSLMHQRFNGSETQQDSADLAAGNIYAMESSGVSPNTSSEHNNPFASRPIIPIYLLGISMGGGVLLRTLQLYRYILKTRSIPPRSLQWSLSGLLSAPGTPMESRLRRRSVCKMNDPRTLLETPELLDGHVLPNKKSLVEVDKTPRDTETSPSTCHARADNATAPLAENIGDFKAPQQTKSCDGQEYRYLNQLNEDTTVPAFSCDVLTTHTSDTSGLARGANDGADLAMEGANVSDLLLSAVEDLPLAGAICLSPNLSLTAVTRKLTNRLLLPFSSAISRLFPALPVASLVANEAFPWVEQDRFNDDPEFGMYNGRLPARIASENVQAGPRVYLDSSLLQDDAVTRHQLRLLLVTGRKDTLCDPVGSYKLFEMVKTNMDDVEFWLLEDVWHYLTVEPGSKRLMHRCQEWISSRAGIFKSGPDSQ